MKKRDLRDEIWRLQKENARLRAVISDAELVDAIVKDFWHPENWAVRGAPA